MHAFDLAKMREGKIIVRRAKAGETMTTLDGKKRTLTTDMLVIADAERARRHRRRDGRRELGESSSATKRIVFEAAYFTPGADSRDQQDSSASRPKRRSRFERGVDRTAPPRAMARALRAARTDRRGQARRATSPTSTLRRISRRRCVLDRARIAGLLGMDVPDEAVERILTSLGFRGSQDPVSGTQGSERVGCRAARRGASTCTARSISSKKSAVITASSTCRRRSPASSRRRRRRIRASRAIAACARRCSAWASPRRSPSRSSRRRPPSRSSNGQAPVALANPLSEKFAVDAAEPVARTGRRAQPQSPPRTARRPPLRDRHALLAGRRNARRRRSRGWGSARPITGAARGGRWISPTSRASSNNSRRSPRSR